jgi:hypothetical protein
MNTCRRLLAALAGLCLVGGIYAAQPPPATKPATVNPGTTNTPVIIRSDFIDDPEVGKDPFFPISKRRLAVKEAAGTPVVGSNLKLKLGGISGPKDNRLAIINNKTYSVGEEFEAKEENRVHKVRVEEIKERSVIVNVDGSLTQEITLQHNF